MLFRIQIRRDTERNWRAVNPVLMRGEFGVEWSDDGVNRVKIGNGQAAWNDLPYALVTQEEYEALTARVADLEATDVTHGNRIRDLVRAVDSLEAGDGAGLLRHDLERHITENAGDFENVRESIDDLTAKVGDLRAVDATHDAAIEDLRQELADEAEARERQIAEAVSGEAEAREQADAAIRQELADEAEARDRQITEAVSSEAEAREQADAAIGERIDGVETDIREWVNGQPSVLRVEDDGFILDKTIGNYSEIPFPQWNGMFPDVASPVLNRTLISDVDGTISIYFGSTRYAYAFMTITTSGNPDNITRDEFEKITNALETAIRNISNLGKHIGTFDTSSVLPHNVSAFAPLVPTANDFVNIRNDENHGGGTTRYIIDAIAGNGTITWTFDIVYASDITGKMDRVPSAVNGQVAIFDNNGQVFGADKDVFVSNDAGNVLTSGTDNGLYVPETFTPMTGLSFQEEEIFMRVGDSRILTPRIEPQNATIRRLLWVSSNPKIAVCTFEGKVTILNEGQAVITAYSIEKNMAASVNILMAYESPFNYTFDINTGLITITGGGDGNPDLIIPATINGRPVGGIEHNAFRFNQLASVVIPDSVEFIGGAAFQSNQLTSVIIGSGVTIIGAYAFHSNQLTSVTIPGNVTHIGGYSFSDNQLTSVTIGDGVTLILTRAFADNKLTSVVIPGTVREILNSSFENNHITNITIGANVTIGNDFSMGINGASFRALYDGNGRRAGTYLFDGTAWTREQV